MEAEALEEEVSRKRRTVMERRDRLQEELQSQAQIRKDIEVKDICDIFLTSHRDDLQKPYFFFSFFFLPRTF